MYKLNTENTGLETEHARALKIRLALEGRSLRVLTPRKSRAKQKAG